MVATSIMPNDSGKTTGDDDRARRKRPRAGAAFMRAVERDPAARAALRRVQRRLRAVADAFQALEPEQSKRERQPAMAQLAEQIRDALRAAGDELAARGLTTPKSLEDWEHLARVIDLPFNTIRAGDYTLQDVLDMARAWLDRQKILRRPTNAAGAKAGGDHGKSARTFTVAALRELAGLKNTALNKYARLAGVRRPRRGQRNFQYSATDVRLILDAIIASTSEAAVLARCRAARREIAE